MSDRDDALWMRRRWSPDIISAAWSVNSCVLVVSSLRQRVVPPPSLRHRKALPLITAPGSRLSADLPFHRKNNEWIIYLMSNSYAKSELRYSLVSWPCCIPRISKARRLRQQLVFIFPRMERSMLLFSANITEHCGNNKTRCVSSSHWVVVALIHARSRRSFQFPKKCWQPCVVSIHTRLFVRKKEVRFLVYSEFLLMNERIFQIRKQRTNSGWENDLKRYNKRFWPNRR